ncbi:MAG TPA: hypothetical protein VJH92_04395 [Candidatus Nanoarchaeia archaeon]|nr:hypothetical protein [Candidatus Nanoarchaeia archaeon]
MKKTLLPILAIGVLSFAGNAYADSTVKAETPKPAITRTSRWDKSFDVGIGFRDHGAVYLGFSGVNQVLQDTIITPHTYKNSYGIEVGVVLGMPNPNSGGLTSEGLVFGLEKYVTIKNRQIPIGIQFGGAFYNPKDPEAKLEVEPFGIFGTNIDLGKYDFKFRVHLQKSRGLNVFVGKRFF